MNPASTRESSVDSGLDSFSTILEDTGQGPKTLPIDVNKPARLEYISRALQEHVNNFSVNTLKAACDGAYWVDDPDQFKLLAFELAQVPNFHLTRIGRGTILAKLIREARK